MLILISSLLHSSLAINRLYENMTNSLALTYYTQENLNILSITFSKPLKLTSEEMLSMLYMDLSESRNTTFKVKEKVLSEQWVKNVGKAKNIYDVYHLEINYPNEFFFEQLTIYFTTPYSIRDYKDQEYLNNKYQIIQFPVGPSVSSPKAKFMQIISYCLLGLGVLLFLVFKIVLSQQGNQIATTMSLFWINIDGCQIMNLLLYLPSELTEQLQETLRSFNILNFNFDFKGIFNFFNQDSSSAQFQRIQSEGLTMSLMYNTFIQWILIATSIIVTVFSVVALRRQAGAQGCIKNLVEYRIILRVGQITLNSLSFAMFIEGVSIDEADQQASADLAMLILTLVWITSYIFTCGYILNKPRIIVNLQYDLQKYGVLYGGLQTKAIFKRNANLIFDLRKILYGSLIVLFYKRSNTCISLLIMIQIFYVMILATKFPYQIRVVNQIFILTEILMTGIYIFFGCTILLDYISNTYLQTITRKVLGWLISGMVLLVVFLRTIFMIPEFFQMRDLHKQRLLDKNRESENLEKEYPDDYGLIEFPI